MNYKSSVIAIAAIATFVILTTSLSAPPPAHSAEKATPPAGGYSYSAGGSDKQGDYKIFQQYITKPDQTGKKPKAWIRVTRTLPSSKKGDTYDSEFMLFYLTCKNLTYAVAARVKNTPDGKEVENRSYTERQMIWHKLPDVKTHVNIIEGVSSPELHAASVLDQSCHPFE